jgi:hypothetical protein
MNDSRGQKVDKLLVEKIRHIRFLAFSMSKCPFFMAKEKSRRFNGSGRPLINL